MCGAVAITASVLGLPAKLGRDGKVAWAGGVALGLGRRDGSRGGAVMGEAADCKWPLWRVAAGLRLS